MIAYTQYLIDGRVRLEAESLVRWGYQVFFLVPKAGDKPTSFELCGVKVQELNTRQYNGKSKLRYALSYLLFSVLAFVTCTRLWMRERIGVVHVHNMPDFLVFAGLIPRLFGCKLILDVHDTMPETYGAKFGVAPRLLVFLLRCEERVSCWLAHRIIAVNHVQREALTSRGIPAGKIATVITMPAFMASSRPSHEHKNGQTFKMVNHGTMAKRLGIDLIVTAAARLVHEIPGFELHIIGAGDDRDEFVRLVQSLGLVSHVHFHPCVPWDKLAERLEMMDVGIIGNRANVATHLMLPLKLIDYVTLGIPAIAPRLKTIEYYFGPDLVTFYEPENIDSMVTAVVSLYRDTQRRQRQPHIAKSFLEKYRWDNPPNGLKELYDHLS